MYIVHPFISTTNIKAIIFCKFYYYKMNIHIWKLRWSFKFKDFYLSKAIGYIYIWPIQYERRFSRKNNINFQVYRSILIFCLVLILNLPSYLRQLSKNSFQFVVGGPQGKSIFLIFFSCTENGKPYYFE